MKTIKNNKKNGAITGCEPIAVIGIGCIFPRANNHGAYWANLKNGVDAIRDIPESHWRIDDYYSADISAQDHTHAKRGGFLSSIDFAPLEFGITPNAIEATDTSQLLGMVAAKQALMDAGYDDATRYDKDRVSVILGVTGALELTTTLGARLGHPKWRKALRDEGLDDALAEKIVNRISEQYVPWQENSFPGLLGNVVAGRISNYLDLGGTNCVVDAACASSFSAIHLAIMELQTGRADMVISGGIDTFNDVFMYTCFGKTMALSPTSDAKPFDKDADGTILGEGLGIVVLKCLKDAKQDKDNIYAVIRAIGTSSDGKGKAIYAPSAQGQVKAIRQAYRLADVDPSTIDLLEAHGTGTKVGDAVEIKAISEVYQNGASAPWCAIGSVKSQIGHAKAAAGAAGLIKAALALHHKVLPPTIKVTNPTPALCDNSPFYINQSPKPWVRRPEHPRRAAVSAFGFGGSNFHCVLEEYDPEKAVPDFDGATEMLAVSADTPKGLMGALDGIPPGSSWEDLSRLFKKMRAGFNVQHPYRLTAVIKEDDDMDALMKRIGKTLESEPNDRRWSLPEGVYFGLDTFKGKVGFLFPGQGSQYVGMLREMSCQFPQMLSSLEMADLALRERAPLKSRISDTIYPAYAFTEDEKKARQLALRSTDMAQPAIGAVSAGLCKVLASFGVRPDVVAGHSYGEVVALFAAKILDEQSLFDISVLRGMLMDSGRSGGGGMVAVNASLRQAEEVLRETGLDVVIANKNAPNQVVLSGDKPDLEKAKAEFKKRKIPCKSLPVANAFHSRAVSDAAGKFLEGLKKVAFSKGEIPVFSNTTGRKYPARAGAARELLANQLAKPVDFMSMIKNMYADGVRTFVEVGPGLVLKGLVSSILGEKAHVCLGLDGLSSKQSGLVAFARVLAYLSAQGYPVDIKQWNMKSKDVEPFVSIKPKMTVPISGVNHVSKRALTPPEPKTSSIQPKPQSKPQPQPQPGPGPNAAPQGDDQDTMMRKSTDESMKRLQAGMAAFQKLQEETARLHGKFLEGQQAATRMLASLLGNSEAGFTSDAPLSTKIEKTPGSGIVEIQNAETPPGVEMPLDPVVSRTRCAEATVCKREKIPSPQSAIRNPREPHVRSVLFGVVSETTGYPVEMLEPEMTLDQDLGIDSIKRVEIFSILRDRLPDAPEIEPKHLGELESLGDIVNHLVSGGAVAGEGSEEDLNGSRAQPVEFNSKATDVILEILLGVVSETTGYPVEMLELGMTLDQDLGIDSIKRVEIFSILRDRLPDAPEIEPKHLGELESLQDIVNHLVAGGAVAGEGREGDREVFIAQPVGSNRAATDEILKVLLGVVSETTGYPVEMLEPEMTLDQDLGIDSIKRVEIFSILRDRLPDAPEIEPKHLGELESLQDVVNHLVSGAQKNDDRVSQNCLLDADVTNDVVKCAPASSDVFRMVVSCEPMETSSDAVQISKTGPFWIIRDERGLCAALQDRLHDLGYETVPISFGDLDQLTPPDSLAGLIVPGAEDIDDGFIANAFEVLRIAEKSLRNTQNNAMSRFVTVSFMDGKFGFGDAAKEMRPTQGGLAGLSKTAGHEWPEVGCLALDMGEFDRVEETAAAIVAEIFRAGPVERGLGKDHRIALKLVPSPLKRRGKKAASMLNPDDVVIVSGGARGVTAEVTAAVAQAYGPVIILLGRSPEPDNESDRFEHLASESEIKRAILAAGSGNMTPKDLENKFRKVMANREIHRNIERLTGFGARVQYHSVDIRDRLAVADVLARVRDEFGKITAVIHGAGVLEDRLIGDKTVAQFEKVYGTKVQGLRNLLSATESDDLKMMALFSSSSARFGRKGQIDYAAANEVLNKMAREAARKRPACRTVAFNWGPWDGGMVTQVLKPLFKEEGIDLISKKAGPRYFIDEFESGAKGPVEVVVMGGPLDASFALDLSLEHYPILRDHVMNGNAVLPAALMMEWLAQGALKNNPGYRFVGFDDFRVLKGIIMKNGDSQHIEITAGRLSANNGTLSITAEIRGNVKGVMPALHASANVILSEVAPGNENSRIQLGDLKSYVPVNKTIYNDALFHGKRLQNILSAQWSGDDMVMVDLSPTDAPSAWMDSGIQSRWIADPGAIDGGFQAMILWSFQQYRVGSLPNKIGKYRQFKRQFPPDGVRAAVRVKERSESRAVADIEFLDKTSDELVARIEDYECILDASLNEAFRRHVLG